MNTKTIILTILISLLICNICNAKVIYSTDHHFSFNTPDNWYYYPCPTNDNADGLLGVAADKNNIVLLQLGKIRLIVSDFSQLTYSEKSIIRDKMIKRLEAKMKKRGYMLSINKTSIKNNSIIISYKIRNENNYYAASTAYTAKDGLIYIISFCVSPDNIEETLTILKSLQVDGVGFDDWIKQ